MLPYAQLKEEDKERNRRSARVVQAKLLDIRCRIERLRGDQKAEPVRFSSEERESLDRIEHDIWLRDHLLDGYEWSEKTNDALRLHLDVAPFEHVPPEDQKLDDVIIDSIAEVLTKNRCTLVREAKPGSGTAR
jgi:hypothetical protein